MIDNAEFDVALQKHLQREELLYRVKVLPHGSEVEWLVPHCESVQDIERFIISIGIKIKKVSSFSGILLVDDDDNVVGNIGGGDWVETANGIWIYVNTDTEKGFVMRALDRKPSSRELRNRSNFNVQLKRHLLKCEHEYRAKHSNTSP